MKEPLFGKGFKTIDFQSIKQNSIILKIMLVQLSTNPLIKDL